MTISVHPARKEIEDVPPGTWEGTKQDAVMATAQLLEILERKKTGEKAKFGNSEYDAEMSSAQIRAFKLTKVILRKAHRKSLSDAPVPIEKIGFEAQPRRHSPKSTPKAPPNVPLPAAPHRHPLAPRSKSSSPPARKNRTTSPIPITKFPPPPIPPRKSSNRTSPPPPVSLSTRKFSEELSPKTIPSPTRNTPPSPAKPFPPSPGLKSSVRAASPAPKSRPPFINIPIPTPTLSEHEILPVQPYRSPSKVDPPRSPTPAPVKRVYPPQLSPVRTVPRKPVDSGHVGTSPLTIRRGSMRRTTSFRYGEGLHENRLSRSSEVIYSELTEALNDLQRTLQGASAAVEVH